LGARTDGADRTASRPRPDIGGIDAGDGGSPGGERTASWAVPAWPEGGALYARQSPCRRPARNRGPGPLRLPVGPWRTLLDLAALNAREGKNYEFVFLDLAEQCLAPSFDRCLLPLSPGGASNVEYREFDLTTGQFVPDGFHIPANRAFFAWLDRDTLLVQHSLDGSPKLASGFPAVLRLWKRGTPLDQAKPVFTAAPSDSLFSVKAAGIGAARRVILSVAHDYSTFELKSIDATGQVTDLGLPTSLKNFGEPIVSGNDLILQLAGSATIEKHSYPAESLIAYDLIAPVGHRVSLAATAGPGNYFNDSFSGLAATAHGIAVVEDHALQKTLRLIDRTPTGWALTRSVSGAPGASMHIVGADPVGDAVLVREEGFLVPARVSLVRPDAPPALLQADKPIIDASRYVSEIRSARSSDGTMIDYYLVRPRSVPGPIPVIIEGYGGFGVNVEPSYFAAGLGRSLPSWLSRGGGYAIAAIRGGGERGAPWHEAALGIHRQRTFDDFAAVANDLVRSGVSAPRRIGAYGRSFGGLVTAVMVTQHPELFGAALVGVPIVDIPRLGKGDSGIGGGQKAELGDWDDPAQLPAILAYSPYQNIRAGISYPKVLAITSTEDNQVGPGHARKFVAKLQQAGADAMLLEGPTGGHGYPNAFADPQAYAMQVTFFIDSLMN
jgi:prolyl oligopeptidase